MKKPLKLAILGVGLIGGAFGMVLKDKLKDKIWITGTTRTQNSLDDALRLKAIDEGFLDPISAVKDADIIYLSTPVLQIVPLVEKILPHLKSGSIITDAGSTKSYISNKIMEIIPKDIYYVAGHPMTGREKSSVNAATKDLFVNKCYVLLTDTKAPNHAIEKIRQLIELTGANITTLTLSEHDRCASLISHIPHVVAAGLVNLLDENQKDYNSCITLAGGGFKDTTRIASSNADMWSDICISNADPIISHLEQLKELLTSMQENIKLSNREFIYEFFANAKYERDKLLEETKDKYDLI